MVFSDEDGNSVRFAVLDRIAYGGAACAVLPACDDVEKPELVILRIEAGADGETACVDVEQEAVLNAVFGHFAQRLPDEFDFAD